MSKFDYAPGDGAYNFGGDEQLPDEPLRAEPSLLLLPDSVTPEDLPFDVSPYGLLVNEEVDESVAPPKLNIVESLRRFVQSSIDAPGDGDESYPAIHSAMPESMGAETAASSLFVDVASDPRFSGLHRLHQFGAEAAETALNLCSVKGDVNLAKAQRMIDFGAGRGGPTLALAQLASQNGGTVEAIEARAALAEDIVSLGILDKERVHTCNGIDFFSSEEAANQYDMITAFMLDPSVADGNMKGFFDASRNALRAEGKLVVTSDTGTMSIVRQACDAYGMNYQFTDGFPLGPDKMLPSTIVISFPEKYITLHVKR